VGMTQEILQATHPKKSAVQEKPPSVQRIHSILKLVESPQTLWVILRQLIGHHLRLVLNQLIPQMTSRPPIPSSLTSREKKDVEAENTTK